MNKTRYVLMFISAHYAEKVWGRVEKRASLATAITRKAAYILPIKLDDTQLEGIPPTVIYVDARVYGIDGLVKLIREKLREPKGGGTADAEGDDSPPPPPPRMKVPRTPEEMQVVLEKRPYGWEYLLWAGALRLGMESLETKYQDHVTGYVEPSDVFLAKPVEYLQFAQNALQDGLRMGQNFMGVLSPETQVAAFGEPGSPGDPDRILHMANRVTSVYEEFLDWSAKLRGANVTGEHARAALHALANTATSNIEMLRDFVAGTVKWADAHGDAREEGVRHDLKVELTLELDDGYLQEFSKEREAAIDEDDPYHLG
jgi:hypothetical protein